MLKSQRTYGRKRKDTAAEKFDAKKTAAEKYAAEKVEADKCAAKESALVGASTEKAEKAAAEQAVTSVGGADVAITSCLGNQQPTPKESCWTCEGYFSSNHQCDGPPGHISGAATLSSPVITPYPVKVVAVSSPHPSLGVDVGTKVDISEVEGVNLPLLPLCHYCCHLGSGDNPVHYVLQCLCEDKVCSCHCYCSEEQLEHKRGVFPGGFTGSLLPVSPGDRPKARTVADARANKLDYRGVPMASRPCDSENCL